VVDFSVDNLVLSSYVILDAEIDSQYKCCSNSWKVPAEPDFS